MPYESTTLTALRQQVLYELDCALVIPNAYFDSAAATSITSANRLRNSNWGPSFFEDKNTGIFRPGAASAADYFRWAGTLTNTTGALAHTGANYADTTVGSEVPELWFGGVRPDLEVIQAFNAAMQETFFSTYVALSLLTEYDGDMSASTDTNWTDVGTPSTSAKSTTAIRTPYGIRSYQLINNGVANEGTSSARLGLRQGTQFRIMAISSCNVGTASLMGYDTTNSADAGSGTALTHSEEAPMLMIRPWESDSDMKEMRVRMLGTTTTSDIFWNAVWVYDMDVMRYILPTYISEDYKAPSIFMGIPQGSTASSSGSGVVYPAAGLKMVQLTENEDFRFQFHHPDANPYAVQFLKRGCFEYPLFIQARRPYSDLTTWAADEAATTTAPLNELVPRIKIKMIDNIYMPRDGANPKWPKLKAIAERELVAATLARDIKPVARPRPYWGGLKRF